MNNREALANNNYEKGQDLIASTRIERWTNKNTGDVVFLIVGHYGKTELEIARRIQITDLVPDVVVTSANSTWCADDIKGAAKERGIEMSSEQAQSLLEDNAKGIAEYGWDGISNVLDDVDTCDECKRAMNVIPDTETDNGSYETYDNRQICETCKIEKGYKSCHRCEAYVEKEMQSPCTEECLNGAPDPEDCVLCPSCAE